MEAPPCWAAALATVNRSVPYRSPDPALYTLTVFNFLQLLLSVYSSPPPSPVDIHPYIQPIPLLALHSTTLSATLQHGPQGPSRALQRQPRCGGAPIPIPVPSLVDRVPWALDTPAHPKCVILACSFSDALAISFPAASSGLHPLASPPAALPSLPPTRPSDTKRIHSPRARRAKLAVRCAFPPLPFQPTLVTGRPRHARLQPSTAVTGTSCRRPAVDVQCLARCQAVPWERGRHRAGCLACDLLPPSHGSQE